MSKGKRGKVEDSSLRELVENVYLKRPDQHEISPAWLATEVMLALGFKQAKNPTVYLAAHLQFRQVARQLLGDRYASADPPDEDAQHPLFPELQARYPIARKRGEEPTYRMLEYLQDADVAYNVERLRSEARAKLKHADSLAQWYAAKAPGTGAAS